VDRGALVNEDCLKITAWFGERARHGRALVADELLDLYEENRVATSVLLRGMEGFGREQHVRTDSSLTLSEDLPAVAIAVDTRERIEGLVDRVDEICGNGLITLERARLAAGDPRQLELHEGLHEETKLTLYFGRQERVARVPAFVAVCDLLRRRGIAGATALLGVDGTAYGRRERARFFGRNQDVPLVVVAVGSGNDIAGVLPELGALLSRPLVTLERVRVCKRDGALLAGPHLLPAMDEPGRPLWQKLTIFTSEAQLHEGRPIHRAVTRQLRESGASGCTTLRGVWGFHGDHAPHGDRVLQRGRRVPTVTSVIDTPERIAAAFEIIDALTAEHGLVTSELVPVVRGTS
jgi:PII-like signaling protein